jgi:hypothetical protein
VYGFIHEEKKQMIISVNPLALRRRPFIFRLVNFCGADFKNEFSDFKATNNVSKYPLFERTQFSAYITQN